MADDGGTRIAVIEMGRVIEKVESSLGSFGNWFCEAFRQAAPRVEIFSLSVEEATILDTQAAAGVVLSGAFEGVNDYLPWRGRFDGEIRGVLESGLPILGVCFGHQYLADLLGGKVEHCPGKFEMGWYELELTDAGVDDELFTGVGRRFGALETHNDMVVEPPEGAIVLAHSDNTPVQAFRLGETVWGIQFHPEINDEMVRVLLREEIAEAQSRGEREREEHLNRRLGELGRPNVGLYVLGNFARICSDRSV